MNRVGGNGTKRSNVQRHRVAREKGGNGHAFRTKTLKAFPTVAAMESKEDKKAERTERAVLGQKMKIIIMHFHRIALHAIGAELAAIKKISARACAHEGLDFPLLERGLPEIDANIGVIGNILRAAAEQIALLHKENQRGRDQHLPNSYLPAQLPKQRPI